MALPRGKKPATHDGRDVRFSSLLSAAAAPLPKPPGRFGHAGMYRPSRWRMLGNGPDETVRPGFAGAGDCVFAGGAHETMETNRLAGRTVEFTGRQVIGDYSAVTGYVVGDDATDEGTEVRAGLGYRRRVGLRDVHGVRHRIGAYVALDPKDWEQLMQAVYLFAAVGIGFEFPESADEQFAHHEPWDVVPGSRVDGGHYVPVMGRSSSDVAGVVSWARRVPMTRRFYEEYNDEAWAIVFPEELRDGVNERGFGLAALTAALAAL